MKYIITMVVLGCISVSNSFAQKSAEETSSIFFLKGKISPNNENENNSPDPKFNASSISSIKIPDIKVTNSKRLSEMENGMQVIEDVVDKIIKQTYSFSLLSQHKYMITSCIGVKASVGEFNVQFGNPEIKLNEAGKVVIKLTVDEIKFDALKIRMRPCPKDAQCHFSERFTIGGLARDLSMTVTMDPMAMVAASTGICAFSFKGPITVHWRLKSLNLKPLQNNLDDVAKQMIEDALNVSALNIVRDRFISIAKNILPQYFETCKEMYPSAGEAMDVVKGNMKNKENKANEEKTDEEKAIEKKADVKKDAEKWVITPSGAKGATGNVTIALPKDATWYLYFQTTDGKDLVRLDYAKSHSLIPGKYNVIVSSVPVLEVPVLKGMNTRLKAGTLHVVSTGAAQWGIYDETRTKHYVTYTYSQKLGLPAGKYAISLNGQFLEVEIKDGQVTEF